MTEHLTQAVPPYEVAPDTYIVSELAPAGPEAFIAINSAVILGDEPVIVDTGTFLNRDRWLDAVWSLVDPADVRWIFLSHDDHDHVGNLTEVLDACPHATLVTTWFQGERLSGDLRLPLERARWVNNGERFGSAGRFVAVRPPIFDSPTTRGLFDTVTGFYWAVDAFGALVPGPVHDAADVDPGMWEATFLDLNRWVSPWHAVADEARWNRAVDVVASLPITSVGTAHGAPLHGAMIRRGLDLLRTLPSLPEAALPGQHDLDELLAATMVPAA